MTLNNLKPIVVGAALFALAASSFAALPELRIKTQNGQTPVVIGADGFMGGSGVKVHNYVAIDSVKLVDPNNSRNNVTGNFRIDSIRTRGNSTSMGLEKKPYRIKFGGKTSLFGKPAAKSWVLLANYFDQTFALNAIAFELGNRMGVGFTQSSHFVNLYMNDKYLGIYQITEQIQADENRVNIGKKKGWLVEFDYHEDDDVAFETKSYKLPSHIKSPDEWPANDTNYNFVKREVNAMCDSMASSKFPNNGYRDMVDLQSFAAYLMIQMVMDNSDFNRKSTSPYGANGSTQAVPGSNFIYKDKDSVDAAGKVVVRRKIYAGPLWDFDLAAGVTADLSKFPKHFVTYQDSIKPGHTFYRRFYQDDVFKAKYQKTWNKHLKDFQDMPALMDSIANLLSGDIERNFNSYNLAACNGYACNHPSPVKPRTLAEYKDEVAKLKSWWNSRIDFYGKELAKMNIDISKDIAEPSGPTSAASAARQQTRQVGLKVIKNGLTVTANNGAEVVVVSLNGNVVRKRVFTSGNHSVRLGDLPKGMYLARVELDGVRKMARIAVR